MSQPKENPPLEAWSALERISAERTGKSPFFVEIFDFDKNRTETIPGFAFMFFNGELRQRLSALSYLFLKNPLFHHVPEERLFDYAGTPYSIDMKISQAFISDQDIIPKYLALRNGSKKLHEQTTYNNAKQNERIISIIPAKGAETINLFTVNSDSWIIPEITRYLNNNIIFNDFRLAHSWSQIPDKTIFVPVEKGNDELTATVKKSFAFLENKKIPYVTVYDRIATPVVPDHSMYAEDEFP